MPKFYIGFDVGSTTVKGIVIDAATDKIIWSDYQRHDTKQPEKSLELLKKMEEDCKISDPSDVRIFITGSGGSNIGKHIGAKFVQEVNAVSLAVEKLYPNTLSVIELGGQDAKIIIFKEDAETGKKKKIPSMNDKCAGGTGAVIDKINAKLKIPTAELCTWDTKGFDFTLLQASAEYLPRPILTVCKNPVYLPMSSWPLFSNPLYSKIFPCLHAGIH